MSKIKTPSTEGSLFKVHGAQGVGPQNNPPVFSLWHMHPSYCIKSCENVDKAAFADKLLELSQLTWAQIKQAPRHGNGHEKIERNSLKPSIPKHITPDIDFLAFRYSGKKHMVGYRDPMNRMIFHIVWVEKKFGDVYRHT